MGFSAYRAESAASGAKYAGIRIPRRPSYSVPHKSQDGNSVPQFARPALSRQYMPGHPSPLGCPPSDNPTPLFHPLSFSPRSQIFVDVLRTVIKLSSDG